MNWIAFHAFVTGGQGSFPPTVLGVCALALFLVWVERAAFRQFLFSPGHSETPLAKPTRPMSHYVDGFVLTINRKNLAADQRLARKAGQVQRDHGALASVECAGDDMKAPSMAERVPGVSDSGPTGGWLLYGDRRVAGLGLRGRGGRRVWSPGFSRQSVGSVESRCVFGRAAA